MSSPLDSIQARLSWVLKRQPQLFDAVKSTSRSLGVRSPVYEKLAAFFQTHPSGTFVQIGANDGISNDPIREFIVTNERWQGAFVEPMAYLLEQCRRNYRDRQPARFHFINAAVSNVTGQLDMWRFKESELPYLPLVARQITSTDPGHLKKHFPDLNPEHIECVAIPSLTYGGVLQQAGFARVDLLIVDAEGHEQPILESMCQHPGKPTALLFESTHFQGESWLKTKKLLESSGYDLSPLPSDCFAVLKS